MIKYIIGSILLLTLNSNCFAQDAPKLKLETRYIIKPVLGDKLVKAEAAIKALCAYAKIENYSINEDVLNLPGKFLTVSTSNLEVLSLTIQKVFGLEIVKTTFDDETVFYEFKKAPEKVKK
jgi:hypothetical protein